MGSGRKDLFYTDNLLHQRSHYLNSEVLSRLVETVCLFLGQGCWFLFTKVFFSLLNFRWHFCAPLSLESSSGALSLLPWRALWGGVFLLHLSSALVLWLCVCGVLPLYLFGMESKFCYLALSSWCHKEAVEAYLSAYPGSLKITLVKTWLKGEKHESERDTTMKSLSLKLGVVAHAYNPNTRRLKDDYHNFKTYSLCYRCL